MQFNSIYAVSIYVVPSGLCGNNDENHIPVVKTTGYNPLPLRGITGMALSKAMLTMLRLPITIKDKTMAIPNTTKREIRPTHPGEMLREDFMPDYDLNTTSLANALGVSRQTINEILRHRRAISPAMALRLSRLFGNSPEFWLNAQLSWDLWDSEQRYGKELSKIQPLNAA